MNSLQSSEMLEFQLTPNSISIIHMWLSVLLGVSFMLTTVCLLQLAGVRFMLSPKFDRISKFLLAVLASFQIFAWQLYFYQNSHDTVAWWCFAVAFSAGLLLWRVSNGPLSVHPTIVRVLPVAVALVAFVEFAGFAQATRQFSDAVQSSNNFADSIANPGILVEKTKFFATTDCGTTIRLFERQITAEAFNDYLEKSHSLFFTMSERAMLRDQPNVQSNCHGWVFSEGQHVLRGEDVEIILAENNYTEVSKPEPNDVAIYRGEDGAILHTGLVRGSLEGATIVESKWGVGGLYMHIAEEQPYSQDISYYRTDRPSHSILISSTKQNVDATAENSKRQNYSDHFQDDLICSKASAISTPCTAAAITR